MTAEILAGVAGILLSLIFSYVPRLNVKFAALSKEVKQLIMLGLIVVVAGASYGLACWGILADLTGLGLTCDKAGLLGLVRAVVVAIIANQGVYAISPNTQAVRAAKG